MCIVSFIGLDETLTNKDTSKMIEYLNVTSVLIRANRVSIVWNRWLKPNEIGMDAIVEEFRNKVVDRFHIESGNVKEGVSLPEEIIWNTDSEVYVVGTLSEMKGYVESYLRLDKSICGEVCKEADFSGPYIYQIQAERKSEHCVEVQDLGFLLKKEL